MGFGRRELMDWMLSQYELDHNTASSIFSYLDEQYRYLGEVPTDERLVVERTVDEEGTLNIVFHSIFGREVNDALCRILAHMLSERVGSNIGMVVEDHGFVLKLSRRSVDVEALIEDMVEQDLRETLKEAVRKTELMKRRFRHVAGRALMIIRNYKGESKSVGKQQMKSHFLLAACEDLDTDGEFPIVTETYREIMEDAMDIIHAQEVVDGLADGSIELSVHRTSPPSPFAHGMIVQGQSDVIKMEDRQERLQQLHGEVMDRIGDA